MLILSRRLDEVVRISDVIRIHVLGIKGHQVRLGIEAPPEIVVDREEIYLRKQEELKAALARGEIREPR
jgi:carbon storage regulator